MFGKEQLDQAIIKRQGKSDSAAGAEGGEGATALRRSEHRDVMKEGAIQCRSNAEGAGKGEEGAT